MRGTVIKRGNKWQAMWYTHRTIDGKRERKTKSGFHTKKEAERFLRQQIEDVESTIYTKTTRCTVGAYLLNWLEEYSRNLEQNTINGYRNNIENHIIPVIGLIFLDKLTPSDIDKVFEKMNNQGLSGTTQKYVYAVLRKAFNHAVKRRTIPCNVMTYVDVPKKSRFVPNVLNQEQLQILNLHLKETDIYIPILICMTLGLRRGEMLGLRWSDIDFQAKIIHIQRSVTPSKNGYVISETKTNTSNRFLQLPDVLITELQKLSNKQKEFNLFKEDGYINIDSTGEIISAGVLQKKFKKALADCSLPDIRIHDLRHSFATLMLGNNVPMKITSQMLGHSSIGITSDIYTHVLTDMQKNATNILSDIFK